MERGGVKYGDKKIFLDRDKRETYGHRVTKIIFVG